SSFDLQQNYPNPFNPETKIRFSVASQGLVELKIFDINGKEIAVPFKSQLRPGVYEYSWNASNFPSGVYLYKISSGKFSLTKKMVLVK
ncbi:MAG: T9SS type A sorting domain-containing protein, partial [Ignavibacteria bacterium]